ncbi:GM16059 [Drosophila sechellia]|uniref:GM16059 n=1 Tax=Drosophila sechellia TaxID=7238 RepID=B4HXP6_DROSE|nr:GM16059 [Drosophila sechellia]
MDSRLYSTQRHSSPLCSTPLWGSGLDLDLGMDMGHRDSNYESETPDSYSLAIGCDPIRSEMLEQ